MDWDEAQAKKPSGMNLGEDLSRLSVWELEARIAELEREIARVAAEVQRKQAQATAADAIFKR